MIYIPCLFGLHVNRECHIPWTDTGVELAETILFQEDLAEADDADKTEAKTAGKIFHRVEDLEEAADLVGRST